MGKVDVDYGKSPCPVCKRDCDNETYSEWGWGTVEQHLYCEHCGLIVEQAYSPPCVSFSSLKVLGWKLWLKQLSVRLTVFPKVFKTRISKQYVKHLDYYI